MGIVGDDVDNNKIVKYINWAMLTIALGAIIALLGVRKFAVNIDINIIPVALIIGYVLLNGLKYVAIGRSKLGYQYIFFAVVIAALAIVLKLIGAF